MLRIILSFIINILVIKATDYNKDNKDNFCKYLIDDRSLIDKQLHYNAVYGNNQLSELYNERKKTEQMIFQLCLYDLYE
jgi:hypothetical protein